MFDQKKIKNLVNSYPLIQITGGLVHVQEIIIQELTDKLQQNTKFEIDFLVVVKKWSSDIARFIESAEIMDKEITYAGLDLTLEQMGFEFVPKVEQKGQYSRLGDTISIWPIGYKNPIKVEFFDEKIESIYFFDELYGRKLDAIDRFFLSKINILDDKVEWENIAIFPSNEISSRKKLTGKKFHFINGDNKVQLVELYDRLSIKQDFLLIVFDNENLPESIKLSLNLSYPQLFYSRLDIAQQEMERLVSEGYQVFLQTEHLEQIPKFFKNYLLKDGAYDLQAGFVNKATKEILLTDRELFGTIYITKEKQKRLSSKQAQKLLSQIEGEVEIGDYVVPVYAGITREKDQEYLHLKYADNDELLIPLNQIHKITKYIGVSNELPKIGKLDKVSWRKTTEKTKKIINILAKDLVEHYAKVQLASAFPIQSIDSDSYHQFNSAFQFEETPDQKRTINEVLSDLSRERPMNRLIVGDVGFGKTEVAMRACFKIIENGKQVAVLVPTTVLAAQHYKVFSDRFRKFNTKIAMMSRFSGKEENSKIAQELANGKIDIVIGTHRLLSTDVKFKNLGLLVIDEEQKFGVRQKEKLKKLKYGVHVLSMTATPIPRTLSMALSEIQDISIISTPPEGRKSIDTKVERFSWNKIREVIKHEIDRNGQVYFVHNRVQTIDSIKAQFCFRSWTDA
ncbi:MAG: Transcription-repair coupling factor [candidate division WS6 bacterium GW2011_GWA2_37_6]|uniref:Transcription-repair coupling factor n=1 Tax=candidate division WS6 bacterium GW2011_GWA2_37_6 TaxID=1619087 RepID=A0A0G0GUI3_9BACT|nr:MAG: Transcription-repair coupling factor [candidate division WS6 bacterium GW2011_GWA2_37_6]